LKGSRDHKKCKLKISSLLTFSRNGMFDGRRKIFSNKASNYWRSNENLSPEVI
jgi:hypothetical protein